VQNNKFLSHTQITLTPGLANAILMSKKVKEFEFYGYLKTLEKSGCIKDYDLFNFSFEAQLSLKTVKRRIQALKSLGWIDVIGNNIYLRSLRKICLTVGCDYNENSPKKIKCASNKVFTIKDLLRSQSLKEHIKSQEYKVLKNASKEQVKYFKSLGVRGMKAMVLNDEEQLKSHSSFLRSMDVTASREKCSELWGCSTMEASRTLKSLSRQNIISDQKRAGKVCSGNEMRAAELRRAYDDPTIFHKKGNIYKKLYNKVCFLKRSEDTGELISDSIYGGGEDFCSKFLFKLDLRYSSFLAKYCLGIKF